MEVFNKNYIDIEQKLWLVKHVITNVDQDEATFKGTIHLVKENKDVEIFGDGNGPIDAFYQVPAANDPKFCDIVLDICNKEKVDVYFPNVSAEVEAVRLASIR